MGSTGPVLQDPADRVSEAMNSVYLSFLLHTMGLLVWYVAQAGLQLTK